MKKLLLLPALLALALGAHAEPLAIFARDDARAYHAAAPAEPRAAAFFADYFKSRHIPGPYDATIPLVNPPEWGKNVSAETGGQLHYQRSFPAGFVCQLQLHGLAPNHTYILTLNGNPKLAGNELLLTPVPGLADERYYDFLDIKTDADGRYEGEFGVYLKTGDYASRLYVKDTSDFKIVLFHDYFPFRVE